MKGRNMTQKVIIDCDPGIDDSLALMLALKSPELEVMGITITCGNAPVDMGGANALKILEHMDRLDVGVYRGAEQPLEIAFTNALDTHGADGLGESFLPEVRGAAVQEESALDFMKRALMEEGCMVIALGPMTNLARLAQEAPEAFGRITRLVSMGGNHRSHGNCSPVAEYNYWCDPHAAAIVFEAMAERGKKVEMIGLDVTRKIVLTPSLLSYIERLRPEEGAFIRAITKFYFDFHWRYEHLIGCVINDPLAVAYAVNSSLCQGFEAYTQIATEGIARGQSIADEMHFYQKPANARILTQVDAKAFFRHFLSRILDTEEADLDLVDVLVGE